MKKEKQATIRYTGSFDNRQSFSLTPVRPIRGLLPCAGCSVNVWIRQNNLEPGRDFHCDSLTNLQGDGDAQVVSAPGMTVSETIGKIRQVCQLQLVASKE